MELIMDFNILSEAERREFAEELVQKINTEHLFTSEAEFKIATVEADAMSGDLAISIEQPLTITDKAIWQCDSEEETNDDPGYDAEVLESEYAFKDGASVEVDGYTVTLSVDDWDTGDTIEVIVDDYSEEDAGIGSYEYWGHKGYDSRPYVEVTGSIVKDCLYYLTLWVEPTKK